MVDEKLQGRSLVQLLKCDVNARAATRPRAILAQTFPVQTLLDPTNDSCPDIVSHQLGLETSSCLTEAQHRLQGYLHRRSTPRTP